MSIEQLVLKTRPLRISKNPSPKPEQEWVLDMGLNIIHLSNLQHRYLTELQAGKTIEQLIVNEIAQKKIINFIALYNLIFNLVKNDQVTTLDIRRYFEDLQKEDLSNRAILTEETLNSLKDWAPESLYGLPFFRNMRKEVVEKFVAHTEIVHFPERTKFISAGDKSREMYVVLEGMAAVYRVDDKGKRRIITSVPPGSVVGEGAFLFGHARTADVVTNSDCIMAKINHNASVFSPLFKDGQQQAIQERFWILHGLMASNLFKQLPTESLDKMLFSGKSKKVPLAEFLTEEGAPGQSFFVLIQGEVAVTKEGRLLKTLKQGDIIGEISILVTGGNRVATTQAISDCLVLEINKDDFLKVLSQNLLLAKEIQELAEKRQGQID